MKIKYFGLLIVFLCLGVLPVNAQEDDPPPFPLDTILVCVAPQESTDLTQVVEIFAPYLLIFRNSTAFGLVLPVDANVIIYSTYQDDQGEFREVHSALYEITPDAATGGYRPGDFLAQATLNDGIPSAHLCGDAYLSYPLSTLPSSVPMPVSRDHAVLVQVGANDLLLEQEESESPRFLGVFAFQFSPTDVSQFQARFQFIQLVGGIVDINLPFYTEVVNYLLIANKNTSVRRSYAEAPDDFDSQSFANDRSNFIRGLREDGLDLWTIMTQDHIRIFPLQGIEQQFSPGGYIRLETPPGQSERTPAFTVGETVCSIDDDTIDYVSVGQPRGEGTLQSHQPPEILRIEEEGEFAGQLVVRYGGGAEIVIDAWLVDLCDS
jgi:hypothetical protein